LEHLLLSKLGAPRANRKAYEERPDVREATALACMLGRMVCEVRSLVAAVQERREYAEVCLKIELASDLPSAEECERLTSAVSEAGDQISAVQCVLEDAEQEATNLSARITDGYDADPGTRLDPVNELADRALKLLATLKPAAEALGDFRKSEKAEEARKSKEALELKELAKLLETHNVGAKTPLSHELKREREKLKLVENREKLIQKAENENLQEQHDQLWAELEELEKEREDRDNEFEVYHQKEIETLEAENAALAEELEKQLADMNRCLDLIGEECETQVTDLRKRKRKVELDGFDGEATVSMTWHEDEGAFHATADGVKITTEGEITCGDRQYKMSPDDIEFLDDVKLGHGASGVVSKGVLKKTGQMVAIKTITIDSPAKREQLLSEIKGLVQAEGCPYLVQWYAGFASKLAPSVHVVLEFMDLGSLADMKARTKAVGVPAAWLWHVAKQVTGGLAYLHSKRLLHRDVKPGNILHNSQGEVKLTDFGISKIMSNASVAAGTFVGTSTYMSPERCLGEDYGFPSDIWSAGMVFYELATGKYPFSNCKSFIALYDQLCEKPEPRLKAEVFPEEFCDFVACCLMRDLTKRSSCSALLAHPFLSKDGSPREEFAAWLATLC